MAENRIDFSSKKCFCVITGASRGIGKQIAIDLAKVVGSNSVFLLTARQTSLLQETCKEVENAGVYAAFLSFSLENSEESGSFKIFEQTLETLIAEHGPFESCLIFHNAGTLGDNSKKAVEFRSAVELRHYLDVNVVSFILLNNIFLRCSEPIPYKVVVNITSIVAIQGIPSYAIYGTGKAAREGFMKVLAAEQPNVRVINYSPGPVLTDMQKEVQEKAWDQAVRDFSTSSEKNGTLVTCEQTVAKLLGILQTDTFASGSHVDYYDA